MRRRNRFLDVLDGDQADADGRVVDHQQLLDPPLVEDPPRVLLAGAEADDGEIVPRHQLRHGWPGFSAKRTSRLVRMPHSLPDFSTIGMPLIRLRFISSSASASVWSGVMVIGLTTMPLSKRFTARTAAACSSTLEIAVEDADAAQLGQGDRHVGLGHRVHRRGHDRNVERNFAGQLGARVGLARQDAQIRAAAGARRRTSVRAECQERRCGRPYRPMPRIAQFAKGRLETRLHLAKPTPRLRREVAQEARRATLRVTASTSQLQRLGRYSTSRTMSREQVSRLKSTSSSSSQASSTGPCDVMPISSRSSRRAASAGGSLSARPPPGNRHPGAYQSLTRTSLPFPRERHRMRAVTSSGGGRTNRPQAACGRLSLRPAAIA